MREWNIKTLFRNAGGQGLKCVLIWSPEAEAERPEWGGWCGRRPWRQSAGPGRRGRREEVKGSLRALGEAEGQVGTPQLHLCSLPFDPSQPLSGRL